MFSGFETILTSRLENGNWTESELAPFAGKYYDGWPALQPDGKRMFFHSARPLMDSPSGKSAAFNIMKIFMPPFLPMKVISSGLYMGEQMLLAADGIIMSL